MPVPYYNVEGVFLGDSGGLSIFGEFGSCRVTIINIDEFFLRKIAYCFYERLQVL